MTTTDDTDTGLLNLDDRRRARDVARVLIAILHRAIVAGAPLDDRDAAARDIESIGGVDRVARAVRDLDAVATGRVS